MSLWMTISRKKRAFRKNKSLLSLYDDESIRTREIECVDRAIRTLKSL